MQDNELRCQPPLDDDEVAVIARQACKYVTYRFIQLPHALLDSSSFGALHPAAVKIFLRIWRRYNGRNNGRLLVSVTDLMSECSLSEKVVRKALKELEAEKFIRTTIPAERSPDPAKRRSPMYAVCALPLDEGEVFAAIVSDNDHKA